MRRAFGSPLVETAFNTRLELQTHGKLKLSRLAPRWFTGDEHRPLIDIDRRGISVWVAGVYVVKRVIGIQPELREQALMKGEILLHRYVRGVKIRAKFCIPARVANLVEAWSGKVALGPVLVEISKAIEEGSIVASGIERTNIRRQARRSPVGITRSIPRQVITAARISERERQPARPVDDGTNLPATDHLIDPPWRLR